MRTYSVNRQRWEKLDIFNQMGNIASEVGRSYAYLKSEDKSRAEQAMYRAVDLLDATSSALVKQKSAKAKEVLRAKEEYLRTFYDQTDLDGVERYFNHFAVAARTRR